MAKVKLTPGRIRDFTTVRPQEFLWDELVPGLAVRATAPGKRNPEGSKSFTFQGKTPSGQDRRITIGDVRTWSIDDAREEARTLQKLIDKGIDPRDEKRDRLAEAAAKREAEELARKEEEEAIRRSQVTVFDAWEKYVDARRSKWSERHLNDHIKAMLPQRTKGEGKEARELNARVLASLAALPLSALTSERIAQWLEAEAKTRSTQAALAFRLLRAFLNWCNESSEFTGIAPADACATKKVRENVPRATAKGDALQREQLLLWFEGVGRVKNQKVAVYLQGLLITGARPNELAGLRWADVDFQWNSLEIHDKVEGSRIIPLTPYFSGLLRVLKAKNETPPAKYRILHGRKLENDLEGWKPSAFVFGSSRSLSGQIENAGLIHRQMLASVGIPNVTLHGLRRSFGSLSEWCECPVGIVAQIQGHKPSATAEKHYRVRPLDLLRMWHTKIEAWILEQAGIQQAAEKAAPLTVAA